MKKVIRTMAAVAMLMTATTVLANEPKLETIENTKSLVFEWDTHLVDTTVKILDTDDNIIYSEYVSNLENYIKRFDLNSLPYGKYFLTVENSMSEVTYVIDVNDEKVKVLDKEENLKPVYRNDAGRVFLNYLNTDKEQVRITVYDSLGRKLFAETLEDELVIEKVFNFTDAFEGDYTIVVNHDTETFYETVSVK